MKTINGKQTEMRDEYDFSRGQRGRYVGRIKPGDTEPRSCKVLVAISLDADVVQHFRRRAADSGTSFEDQINDVLRDHVAPTEPSGVSPTESNKTADADTPTMSAEEHLDKARNYLSQAKDLQDREIDWAAWDNTFRAIYEALSAVVGHERGKGNVAFEMGGKLSDWIDIARSLEILSEKQCWRAQLIMERTRDSHIDSMSVEDSKDAMLAAEDIIQTVEQRIAANPHN